MSYLKGDYYLVVANNPNGLKPKQIYFGGVKGREDYTYFNWLNYKLIREIDQYYGPNRNNIGYVAVYEHKAS